MLLIFGGLPGVGKTTIAQQVAQRLSAVYLRIDTLEQALVRSGLVNCPGDLGGSGYDAAYALAADNLRLGLSVVADSVNPLQITRAAWRNVAIKENAGYLEIEVVCSDIAQHKLRIANRSSDIPGLALPTWQKVVDREYDPWNRAHLILDTAKLQAEEAVGRILESLARLE